MNMSSERIELELYRSGLLRSTIRPHVVTARVKTIRKHAAKYDKARLAMCNGIERWNQGLQRFVSELTEADQERLDKTMEDAERAITDELKALLKPGTAIDFRRDPRAPILRFVNKDNTKDGWID